MCTRCWARAFGREYKTLIFALQKFLLQIFVHLAIRRPLFGLSEILKRLFRIHGQNRMTHRAVVFDGFASFCFHICIVTAITAQFPLVSNVTRISTPVDAHMKMPIGGKSFLQHLHCSIQLPTLGDAHIRIISFIKAGDVVCNAGFRSVVRRIAGSERCKSLPLDKRQ